MCVNAFRCLVAIATMTDVLCGDSVRDLFQAFLKKHSLESCISIKFGQNGGLTLNMVAESKEIADCWVRGLQKLIVNKGLLYNITSTTSTARQASGYFSRLKLLCAHIRNQKSIYLTLNAREA